jgi:hypothetical protein
MVHSEKYLELKKVFYDCQNRFLKACNSLEETQAKLVKFQNAYQTHVILGEQEKALKVSHRIQLLQAEVDTLREEARILGQAEQQIKKLPGSPVVTLALEIQKEAEDRLIQLKKDLASLTNGRLTEAKQKYLSLVAQIGETERQAVAATQRIREMTKYLDETLWAKEMKPRQVKMEALEVAGKEVYEAFGRRAIYPLSKF